MAKSEAKSNQKLAKNEGQLHPFRSEGKKRFPYLGAAWTGVVVVDAAPGMH